MPVAPGDALVGKRSIALCRKDDFVRSVKKGRGVGDIYPRVASVANS